MTTVSRKLVSALAFFVLWTGASQVAASSYEEVIYYHNDALGSPVLATDPTGAVLWREEYSPYGSRLTHESREVDCSGGPCQQIESPWDEKQWYTGKLEETPLGIQYFGARWYEPEIGRFLSTDPVQFSEDNIFSFNRYAYANNNPYRYVDPDGRIVETAWDVFNIGLGVASFSANILSGNWSGAALDAAGVVADTVAAVVPGLPGGASSTIRAGRVADNIADVTKKAPDITTPYKRPSGATTKAQRESVQGKPCVDCGATTSKQYADHKDPLVKEYYRSGTIDKTRMRDVDSVQPQCPTCSNKQGAELSRYSRQQKKDRGL